MKGAAARKQIDKANIMAKGSLHEPDVDSNNYKLSLVSALNWYGNDDDKVMVKYLETYLKANKYEDYIPYIGNAKITDVITMGKIARLLSRGQQLSDVDMENFQKRIDSLRPEVETVKEEVNQTEEKASKPSIQDHMKMLANSIAWPIDNAIDDIIIAGKTEFNINTFISDNEVNAAIGRKVADIFQPTLEELTSTEPELIEGYAHLTKKQKKTLTTSLKSWIDALNSIQVARKTRKKKAKAPAKIVSKVNYQNSDNTLNLESVLPQSIVDSSEVYLYNTKYNKLTVLRGNLSIRGTTVVGFDETQSGTKRVSKPAEFFKSNKSWKKRAGKNAYDSIKSKESPATGRINDATIILGVN